MAKVSRILDIRRQTQDGTYPLKIRITHKGQQVYIPTDIYLRPDQWDGKEIINYKGAVRRNQLLNRQVLELQEAIHEIDTKDCLDDYTAASLRARLQGKYDAVANKSKTFIEYMDVYIQKSSKKRTKEIYQSTKNKVAEFHPGKINFKDITPRWLDEFDNYMTESGLMINTRAFHFRNIRAVFNYAIENEVISPSVYPFRKFKITHQETKKRTISLKQLRQIRDYPEGTKKKYADIFMLIFYLLGINVIDLFYLKDIKNDRIEYDREKTGRLYSVKVPPEAMEIIQKYKGKDHLLAMGDRCETYRGYYKTLWRNLREIGKEIGCPQLSTYYARHTWASMATELDIPKETISKALGHGDKSVTDVYIFFNMKKVDDANVKVINYVWADKRPKKMRKTR